MGVPFDLDLISVKSEISSSVFLFAESRINNIACLNSNIQRSSTIEIMTFSERGNTVAA